MQVSARRLVTVSLGSIWFLDGILQFQPAMFTGAFISQVLVPTLQGEPGFVQTLVAFGIRLFSTNIFWWNFASASIQVVIGALLVFARPARLQKTGLWLSIVWALIVWIFGEGFGGIFTGSVTFFTGAPGAALLYAVIAAFLLYEYRKPGALRRMPLAAGIVFVIGALLNMTPMFWQPTMLSMLASVPSVSGWLGGFGAQGTMVGNLLAIDALFCIGIFLIVAPNRAAAWTALVFLAAVWWIGQDFGGILTFPFGTATDPNAAPLIALFLLPIFSDR